jgi:hypothetical protein
MRAIWFLAASIALVNFALAQVERKPAFSIPRTWDEQAIASLDLPRADTALKVTHVSADYYYRLPIRRFFKSYPVYHPAKEPEPEGKDYLDWLKSQPPREILHDFSSLKTEADWAAMGPALGKEVFEAPIADHTSPFLGLAQIEDVRNPKWYHKSGIPYGDDGLVPFLRYVVTDQGVRLGTFACAMCHTRVEKLPDGQRIVIQGAQGNFPFDRVLANIPGPPVPAIFLEAVAREPANRAALLLYGAPWIKPADPLEPVLQLRLTERIALGNSVPPGVMMRHGTHPFSPVQVPDLIGVKVRRYLDRTGLIRHRGPGDLMRYAALNQGLDFLNRYNDFVPIVGKDAKELPDPKKPPPELGGGRYSDEQLYALALFLYELKPPENPYLPKSADQRQLVAKGKELFRREDCVRCHNPASGYTNNMLTPALDYEPPDDHPERKNLLEETVGTDPFLATKTQRGTGLYKVPSLQGVWYRGPFEHNGSVATLEDWFDRKRLEHNYVPTGWKGPPRTNTRAVRGHEFGLDLGADQRKALIAFLKTL